MKVDMHLHTKEGSLDGKVPVRDSIDKLIRMGIDGAVITDHDSFKGYDNAVGYRTNEFKVFCGVEYDTSDCGHMIVVIPPNSAIRKILTIRGMRGALLIKCVHMCGGLIGLAHPYGYSRLGMCNTHRYRNGKSKKVADSVDFIEVFNSCCSIDENEMALQLALDKDKFGSIGSDAHSIDCVGKAYTEFDTDIGDTNELINTIKNCTYKDICIHENNRYHECNNKRHPIIFFVGIILFIIYSKAVSLIRGVKRVKLIKKLRLI